MSILPLACLLPRPNSCATAAEAAEAAAEAAGEEEAPAPAVEGEAGPSGLSGSEVRMIYAFLRKACAPEVALFPASVEQWAMRHVHAISNEEAWRATFAKQLAHIDLQLQQAVHPREGGAGGAGGGRGAAPR